MMDAAAEAVTTPSLESVEYWRSEVARRPKFTPALVNLTRALAAERRTDDIIALANERFETQPKTSGWIFRVALKALPRVPALIIAASEMAAKAGDWKQATMGWSTLRRQFPTMIEVHLGLGDCYLQQDRYPEAERAIKRAVGFFRASPALSSLYARIAEKQLNWAEAGRRWEKVVQQAPDDEAAAASHRHALEQAALAPEAEQLRAGPPIEPVTHEQADEVKALLMGFESLGFTCEFGLLQRKFKAEPIGLFRFASTSPKTLLTLLRTRLAGMGDAEEMRLNRGRRDFMIAHPSSGWSMHTQAVPGADTDEDKLRYDQVRRAKYLANKFIDDLEEQTKIYVYARFNMTDAEIDAVYAAMEAYGPNRLICVRLADHVRPAGTVEWRQDRLMVCAIDRKGTEFPGAGWDISVDYWVHFCRLAQERWGDAIAAGDHATADHAPASEHNAAQAA